MTSVRPHPLPLPRVGLPLAMQMIALLVCTLIGAQLVTLALTVLLPPRPVQRWNLDEVVAALSGKAEPERLERKSLAGPPDVSGEGWLVSESSSTALANRLGRRREDVVLAFYTQLPVGGVAVPAPKTSAMARYEQTGHTGGALGSLLVPAAEAQTIPGGPPPGSMPSGGMPGGRFPGGMPPGGSMPRGPAGQQGMPQARPRAEARPGGAGPAGAGRPGGAGPGANQPGQPPAQTNQPGPQPGAQPGAPSGAAAGSGLAGGGPPNIFAGTPGTAVLGNSLPASLTASAPRLADERPAATSPLPATGEAATLEPFTPRVAASQHIAQVLPAEPLTSVSGLAAAARPATSESNARTTAPIKAVPFVRTREGLFELASPPFIEGDFIAAVRQSGGRWLAVAPRSEPFPNSWQSRVMLWFLISLAIVSPLAWLMARRIVVPLRDFARAAEQLGRDPSATIMPLSGPAEIGRAAYAFNQMRNRLRAFVDDRTAMVGAISHDLRTPLTRLRFRIEDAPDSQRANLLREVSEMEAMISQVIAFIRDASTPGPRERTDFAELVRGSVADARLVGGDVEIEHDLQIPVEVDPVGIRRLLGNLLENAIKYGEQARVRVSLQDGEAVAEIVDRGPGIPVEEFDRAFEPFYRSEAARKSGLNGSGLGLAVCRSIARAHGGDVRFAYTSDGFVVRVTVPAAFDKTLLRAA